MVRSIQKMQLSKQSEPVPEHWPGGLLQGGWYTTDELAVSLGVDASTLRRWRTATSPQGPPFTRLSSRLTIYSARDVEEWLEARRVDPGQAA